MRNPEISKFFRDHHKTKKVCKHSVKKLPSVVRYVPYVPDRYRTLKSVTICLFLHAIRPQKCVIKLFILIFLQ